MSEMRFDPVAAAAGLLFVVFGVIFLLEALDVWDVRAEVVIPILVIGLGVALLLGALRRSHEVT